MRSRGDADGARNGGGGVSWVKLDDGFPDHPKVRALSPQAFRAYITVLCYCARYLTDGAVSRSVLKTMGIRARDVAELGVAGLWHETDGGVVVHDYLKYNPARTKVEARREATAARVRDHRDKGNGNAGEAALQEPQDSNCNGVTTPPVTPPPSRPVPVTDQVAAEDLTRGARSEPPDRSQQPGKVTCPPDLDLTAEQVGTLETGGIPLWAITAITLTFRAKAVGDPDDMRTLVAWRKSLAMAVAGDWNNASRRPKKPEANGDDATELDALFAAGGAR